MKRALLVVAVLVGTPVLLLGGMMARTFSGLAPVAPVTTLPGGAIAVADGYVQAFILPTGVGSAALVDCGNDPSATALKAKLDELKLGVKAIFLTHGHRDHVGGCRQFPGAQVFSLAPEQPVVEGAAAAKGPLTRWTKNDPATSPRVNRGLTDGEVVDVDGLKVKAFALPGHTAGSAAFLATGTLFLGDAAAGQADGQVRNAPWVFSDDTAQCAASLQQLARRLKPEEVETLAFAHSGALAGLGPLLAFQP